MTGPGMLGAFEGMAPMPGPGNVLVKVAGCGVCHTDLGFLYGGVPTRKPLPLVLGHEVSGVVVEGGQGAESWVGRRVVVPAVIPCDSCLACRADRRTSCRASKMLGNDQDGGFASHLEVGARWLCKVDPDGQTPPESAPIGPVGLELWELSVVADAVTTPYQALRRCGVEKGDLAVVIGAGGVGSYAIQLARYFGAHVAAVDVNAIRLDQAGELGAGATFQASAGAKQIKGELRKFAERVGARPDGWRVLETSGSRGGQELAWALLTQGGTLSVVGYTPEPATFRLSNLMAMDASAYGNWGCDPALYPEALATVTSGAVRVRGRVRKEPLSEAPRVLEGVHHGQFVERVVLVP
jgi:6-hydroxycyclohex-1-ene-1-carbonyl-CoA dehydrogenase